MDFATGLFIVGIIIIISSCFKLLIQKEITMKGIMTTEITNGVNTLKKGDIVEVIQGDHADFVECREENFTNLLNVTNCYKKVEEKENEQT